MDIDFKYTYSQEILTNTVRLRLLSNGVVHYTYLANSIVSAKEHQLNHNALVEMSGNKKIPTLIDANDFINLTPEARKYIRELETVVPISKRAIVIRTFNQRILANFYINFHKPIITTKIFENYDTAMNWLVS